MNRIAFEEGVRSKLFAAGKCWKKEGWVISLYWQTGDKYPILKIKKVEISPQSGDAPKLYAERNLEGFTSEWNISRTRDK